MQYAALLDSAPHQEQAKDQDKEQAAAIYREVLAQDHSQTAAWTALVELQHNSGHDIDALATAQQMPAASRSAAMSDPAFVTALASAQQAQTDEAQTDEAQGNQAQGNQPQSNQAQSNQAQSALESLLASQEARGAKPFAPAQLELASIYASHGEPIKAYVLFRSVLASAPGTPPENTEAHTEAWHGLLRTLHATGHDPDALAQLDNIPHPVRSQLDTDPAFLRDLAAIYIGVHDPGNAVLLMQRADGLDAARHVTPPVASAVQEAEALYGSGNQTLLYSHLMALGDRPDLTSPQRAVVQELWINWTLARAANTEAARDRLAILGAAAKVFPGNHALLRAEADAYVNAGQPKQALAIFHAQDLRQAQSADFASAISAALAARDMKAAEAWLRAGLAQYPRDPWILRLAAQFEQGRKHAALAAEYDRAANAAKLLSALPSASAAPGQPAPPPAALVHLPDAHQGLLLANFLGVVELPAASPVAVGNGTQPSARASLVPVPKSGAAQQQFPLPAEVAARINH